MKRLPVKSIARVAAEPFEPVVPLSHHIPFFSPILENPYRNLTRGERLDTEVTALANAVNLADRISPSFNFFRPTPSTMARGAVMTLFERIQAENLSSARLAELKVYQAREEFETGLGATRETNRHTAAMNGLQERAAKAVVSVAEARAAREVEKIAEDGLRGRITMKYDAADRFMDLVERAVKLDIPEEDRMRIMDELIRTLR